MSSMMDLASALGGGGGGAPPGMDGGPPPDMGGGPPSPDQSAPPDDTGQGAEQFSNSLDALDAAEQAIAAFIQLDPDEIDRAAGAKIHSQIIQLKAANQKSAQTGDLKSLARALQGGPGANAGPIGQAIRG